MSNVVGTESYKVKDLTEWTPADVREFFQAVIPGHSCVDFFTYTSGYVLCSMDKDDLRRQARDEEAANVIWAELKGCRRKGAAGARQMRPEGTARVTSASSAPPRGAYQARQTFDTGVEDIQGSPYISVYVKTSQEVALEFEVLPSDTVALLKARVAEREGTAAESQRLISGGMNLHDMKTLASYGVRHGAIILLVPQLRDQCKGRPMTFAPRGALMVPGSKAWTPAHPVRPYMPVLCNDVSRGFPVSMEFDCPEDCTALAAAARDTPSDPPVLSLQPPPGRGQVPTETRIYFDPDTEGVRLDTTGNTLSPSSRYEAFVHFGGRGGDIRVTLVTGASVVGAGP